MLFQSFPLVHAILIGKSQQIYVELLQYIRNVLPLSYDQLKIITDFEQGLLIAVNLVFPESKHQGCYFHYCQVNSKCIPLNLLKLIVGN